jgi:hypothetical protein
VQIINIKYNANGSKNKKNSAINTVNYSSNKDITLKGNKAQANSNELFVSTNNIKYFICIGGYPAIKEALIKREWVEVPDSNR